MWSRRNGERRYGALQRARREGGGRGEGEEEEEREGWK